MCAVAISIRNLVSGSLLNVTHKPVLLYFSQQWAHPILHQLKYDLLIKFFKYEGLRAFPLDGLIKFFRLLVLLYRDRP